MSDLICRKTMMRCQTPGMCAPHGGCFTGVLRQADVRYAGNAKQCQQPQAHPDRCGCVPHGTEQVSSAWLAQLREEYRLFGDENKRLTAENAAMAERCRELEDRNERIRDHSKFVAEGTNKIGAALRAVKEALGLPVDASVLEDLTPAIDTLRAEVERLRNDAERITWLAAQARMIYGHKCEASYQLSELPDLIQSGREECSPDDLRRAIDAALEASR